MFRMNCPATQVLASAYGKRWDSMFMPWSALHRHLAQLDKCMQYENRSLSMLLLLLHSHSNLLQFLLNKTLTRLHARQSPRCTHITAARWDKIIATFAERIEGSATKEISYTSWRNQLKSIWNHEKSKQISLKSSSEISPTLQPHPLLQHMTSFWGKSRWNQREIRKSRTPKLLVADPSERIKIIIQMAQITAVKHTAMCAFWQNLLVQHRRSTFSSQSHSNHTPSTV